MAEQVLQDEAGRSDPAGRPRVSVIIKALNEEEHIAEAIASAQAALAGLTGEVILADSASTDRTVEIAATFPITIVQLAHPHERRCGIGPQLGYQHARGEFIYILDGDMILDPQFLAAAVRELEADPGLGGVGGLVEQMSTASYQFRGLRRRRHEARAGEVRWLDMGGLYRRQALEEVGYFSNRNLHAFEELELGLRLSAAGWRLRRLAVPGVQHRGYTLNSMELLRHRWRSGYLQGAGEIIRASWRKPWFFHAIATQKHLLIGLGLWAGLAVGVLLYAWSGVPLLATLVLALLLVTLRWLRCGSLRDALLGQLVWQVHALALLRGLLTRPQDPRRPVASRVLLRTTA